MVLISCTSTSQHGVSTISHETLVQLHLAYMQHTHYSFDLLQQLLVCAFHEICVSWLADLAKVDIGAHPLLEWVVQFNMFNCIFLITHFYINLAQVKKGEIFVTQPGAFPCKAIMHVCGQKDTDVIKKLTQDILLQCERSGYQSVAIPAICAGQYLCLYNPS